MACVFVLAWGLHGQVTVFSHATIIDGSGREPLRDATLVVSNGRIADIGPAAKVKTPEGAQVIDLSGQTIIPGIINLHSHIGENTAGRVRTYAKYGITSTAGLGGDGDEVLKLRDEQGGATFRARASSPCSGVSNSIRTRWKRGRWPVCWRTSMWTWSRS